MRLPLRFISECSSERIIKTGVDFPMLRYCKKKANGTFYGPRTVYIASRRVHVTDTHVTDTHRSTTRLSSLFPAVSKQSVVISVYGAYITPDFQLITVL